MYFLHSWSEEQVKAEYHRLCKVYHPDTPTGNAIKMQEVNNEYNKLKVYYEMLEHKGNMYVKTITNNIPIYEQKNKFDLTETIAKGLELFKKADSTIKTVEPLIKGLSGFFKKIQENTDLENHEQ